CIARRQAHRAGEAGRGAAVLARIIPGTDLAGVLHPLAGLVASQQVDLQPRRGGAVADRGGGGEAFGEEIAHARGATLAEELVALRIAFAVVDRTQRSEERRVGKE